MGLHEIEDVRSSLLVLVVELLVDHGTLFDAAVM